MGAPFATRVLVLHAFNALCVGFIAVYRSELYRLPPAPWVLSAVVGLVAPLCLPAGARTRLFGGMWPLVIAIPFVGLILSPRLVPSPVTVGPFFFCAAASLTTCVVVLWNVSRRKRSLRTLLRRDPEMQSRLESYFAAATPGAARLDRGKRIFRWRKSSASLSAGDVDKDRDSFYVSDRLARLNGVPRPRWFRARRRMLARALLTEADVTPGLNIGTPLANALAAAVGAIVVTSVVVSSATAQTPLDDARPLPVIGGPSMQSRIEPRLSRVTSLLAGHRAEVRCWSRGDWKRLAAQRKIWIHPARPLGRWSAYAKHERVSMSPDNCATLVRLTYGHVSVRRDFWPGALAWSVATLAHESQHVKGIYNEATAECYGMQNITAAARALGRTEEEGRYLARLYWTRAYPKHSDPAYLSVECRNGRRLDLHPQSNVWP